MPNASHYDVIIIGAGVLGSFHAYHTCKKGLKTLLLEKDERPMEATVRNFGQVVPSGMSQGLWQEYGRRSTAIYKELQGKFDISVRKSGTVYLASDETELTLIHELADINKANEYSSTLMSADDCVDKYPGLKKDYCKGGLFFPTEITVEPGIMIHRLITYMQEQMGLHYKNQTLVQFCDNINRVGIVEDNNGNSWTADKIIICNGRDFRYLFPAIFYSSDIVVSKLQMMRTIPMNNYQLKGSILSGLSIRRYESFGECPSYQSLRAKDIPERFSKWGVHILFKQAADGSIIIGDSHEYASAKDQDKLGFGINQHINDIILEEAKRMFDLPSWQISEYWNGYYAQSAKHDLFRKEVASGIHVITAIGGKGMTASAGLAEAIVNELF